MENDTLKKEADKVINVTYMLSGVLEQSKKWMKFWIDYTKDFTMKTEG